jgi:arylsulfatase A-like enzyme
MAKHPNVLLLVIDCLRSDRIFGPGRTCKTPNIDRLAARGTTFSNIFVENSMTAPSFTSIFTGRYAGNHGVVGMVGVRLADSIPTLAEIFTANGYVTYAEATGPLNPILGVDRGFAYFNFRHQHEYYFSAWGDRLLARFAQREFVDPFFFLLHFWEAHVPFQVQGQFDSPEFGATAYDRAISGLDAFIGKILAHVTDDTLVILTGDHGECVDEVPPPGSLLPYFLDKLRLPPINKARKRESIDNVIDLIAEEPLLHQFAAEVSRLSRAGQNKIGLTTRLKLLLNLLHIGAKRYSIQVRRGLKAGFFFNLQQKFNDHKLLSAVARGNIEVAQIQLVRNSLAEHALHHGYHVYDYLQNVPLVLNFPGLFPGGRRIASELRHIDLLPTLIEALKLKHPADIVFDGSSFFSHIQNNGGADRPVYLEARGGAQAEKVFLIRGLRRNGRGIAFAPFEDGRAPVEFFGPTHAAAAEPAVGPVNDDARTLMTEANSIASSFSPGAGRKLSAAQNAEMCEQLKNLGYM